MHHIYFIPISTYLAFAFRDSRGSGNILQQAESAIVLSEHRAEWREEVDGLQEDVTYSKASPSTYPTTVLEKTESLCKWLHRDHHNLKDASFFHLEQR
jgi:hypothetical protein